jgi:glyceraldehyde 3-phosphate dehydrogenase
LREAAGGPMNGILAYSADPLGSRDIIHNPHSCIYDAPWSMVSGSQVKVVGWYDNEWGYASRTVDLVERLMDA